jgi:uncharacterized membrane protein
VTAPHADELIAEYLARLETALAPIPSARRQELLDDVRAHIAEARSALSDETDADLLNILDRLGDPADMAADEIGRQEPSRPAQPPQRNSRGLEIAAIVLLLLFWPIGVVLLWISDAWTTRDKLIGTLVPPFGYLGTFVLGPLLLWGTISTTCETLSDGLGHVFSSTCPSAGSQAAINIGLAVVVIFYLLGPILSAVYLGVRLRRRPRRPTSTDRADPTPPANESASPMAGARL